MKNQSRVIGAGSKGVHSRETHFEAERVLLVTRPVCHSPLICRGFPSFRHCTEPTGPPLLIAHLRLPAIRCKCERDICPRASFKFTSSAYSDRMMKVQYEYLYSRLSQPSTSIHFRMESSYRGGNNFVRAQLEK